MNSKRIKITERYILNKIMQSEAWDLHTHSTCSDGTCSPLDLIEMAQRNGLRFLSITDHDTLDAYQQLKKLCHNNPNTLLTTRDKQLSVTLYSCSSATTEIQNRVNISTTLKFLFAHELTFEQWADILNEPSDTYPLIIIPGVEISTLHQGKKVDLLAYFINQPPTNLLPFIHTQQQSRTHRNQELIRHLQSLNYPLPTEFFQNLPPSAGRVHIAKYLVEQGYFSDINEVFNKLLLSGRPGFIPRQSCELITAIKTVNQCGGISIIAHPQLYGWCKNNILLEMIEPLSQHGLKGIEAWHSQASAQESKMIVKVANQLGLLTTGGSDFHGTNKKGHDMYHAHNKQLNINP